MAQTLSTVSNLLKTQYFPKIIDSLQEDTSLLSKVLARSSSQTGGDVEALVRIGRNTGIGFRGDGDTLPSAGNSTWVKHTVTPRLAYARIQVSGPAIARLRNGGPGSTKAFLKAFVDESEHTTSWFKKRMNIQLWGGKEGYLCRFGSNPAADATSWVMEGPGTAGQITKVNQRAGARYFHFGNETKVDVIDSDGSDIHDVDRTITAVAHSTNTLTVVGAGLPDAVTTGDFLALGSGKANTDAWEAESFEGLQAAIDNGDIRTTYQGLSRSSYPQLKANVLMPASPYNLRDLSEGLLEDLVKTVVVNGGVDPSKGGYEFRMSLGLHSEIKAMQLPLKRFNSSALRPGGTVEPWDGQIPFVPDVDCPYEMVFLLDWDLIHFLETDPIGFEQEDGGNALLRVADKDAYEARLRWYGDLFCRDVHKMGVIRNLNDTTYLMRS